MRLQLLATFVLSLAGASALGATEYPLKLQNCDTEVTVSKAPQRAVTIKSTATEMLLALGLQDRIVGVGFQDGPLPLDLAEQGKSLKILADKLPSQEVVLLTEPDFIYAGWESSFAADGAGERATLQRLGVATYVAPAACRSVKPPKLTFQNLFDEIGEIGRVFNAEPSAAALIERQRALLATVAPDRRNLKALWYSSGVKGPYVGANANAPAMIMEALGLKNIFADVNEGWVSASWETVADREPDVIVLVDAAWNPAAQKKKMLAEDPVTAKLEAVKNERYLVLPFPAAEAGVRNAPAVVDLAAQLKVLDIPAR